MRTQSCSIKFMKQQFDKTRRYQSPKTQICLNVHFIVLEARVRKRKIRAVLEVSERVQIIHCNVIFKMLCLCIAVTYLL